MAVSFFRSLPYRSQTLSLFCSHVYSKYDICTSWLKCPMWLPYNQSGLDGLIPPIIPIIEIPYNTVFFHACGGSLITTIPLYHVNLILFDIKPYKRASKIRWGHDHDRYWFWVHCTITQGLWTCVGRWHIDSLSWDNITTRYMLRLSKGRSSIWSYMKVWETVTERLLWHVTYILIIVTTRVGTCHYLCLVHPHGTRSQTQTRSSRLKCSKMRMALNRLESIKDELNGFKKCRRNCKPSPTMSLSWRTY